MFSGIKNKFSRNPTRQQTNVRTTSSSLPSPRPQRDITSAPATAPTYEHADKQKGSVDAEAETRAKTDDIIESSQGRAPTTDAPATVVPPSNKGKGTERHTEPHTEQQPTAAEDNYQSFWHSEVGYDMIAEQFGDYNEWTPNSLALFEMLDHSGYYIRNNRTILKNHTDYLDYANVCYYSIIFYIQILRARKAAGKLTGEESSFLRRFDRAYPEESLPIADWMYPILSSIVSVQMEDSKYEWVVPRIASENFFATMNAFESGNGSAYLQPMVPYMLGILRTAVAPQVDYTALNAAGNAEYFDDDDNFIPHRIDAAPAQVFGIVGIQTGANPGTGADKLTVFSAAGTSHPFYANAENLNAARTSWRHTKFRNLHVGAVVPQNSGLNDNMPINTLENFLLMPKSENIEWFAELVNHASVNARFGKKVYNLSQIPQTGGNEVLILCKFKKPTAAARNRTDNYADRTLGVTNNNVQWYPRHFQSLTASFGSTRADLKRSEILQAFSFGVNGALPIIAAAAAGNNPRRLVGETHHDERQTGRANQVQRSGEYWNNNEYTFTLFDFKEESNLLAKPMFNGWKSTFQNKFYQVKPAGY